MKSIYTILKGLNILVEGLVDNKKEGIEMDLGMLGIMAQNYLEPFRQMHMLQQYRQLMAGNVTNININIFNMGMPMVGVGMMNPQMLLMLLMLLMMMQGGMGMGGFPGMPMPFPGGGIPTFPPVMPPVTPPIMPPITPPIMPQPQPLPLPNPGPIYPQPPVYEPKIGELNQFKDGTKVYTTPGGYRVVYQPGKHEVKIISPDGKVTKIWGDPHVNEADGSRWQWKNKTATFVLPDGTKVTMQADGPKGVVRSVDIYTSDKSDHVHMDDRGRVQRSFNRYENTLKEALQADGDTFYTTNNGKDWHVVYRENKPGQRNYSVSDIDAKKPENAKQLKENLKDPRAGFLKRFGHVLRHRWYLALLGPIGLGAAAIMAATRKAI